MAGLGALAACTSSSTGSGPAPSASAASGGGSDHFDVVIVGAGLAGLVVAGEEVIARWVADGEPGPAEG